MTTNVKVYEVAVSFTHAAQTGPYNNCEIAIRCETGLKPQFVIRRERFSFVSDDVEMNSHNTTAAEFVATVRAARFSAKIDKSRPVTLSIRSGQLYGTTEAVVLEMLAGTVRKAGESTSDAATFLADYLATGNETALLVLSDYLAEKFGERMAIATAGTLADVRPAAPVTSPRPRRVYGERAIKRANRFAHLS